MTKIIWIDKKFRKNTLKYIFQCFLATVTILAVLIFLDVLNETAIITALGLVINPWDFITIIFIVLAMLWLAIIRYVLRDYLMDLISPYVYPNQEHKR